MKMRSKIAKGKALRCAECSAVFEPWDEIYFWHDQTGEGLICQDCFDGLFEELTRGERAQLVGSAVTTAQELIDKGRL